mmetsp:Transcript_49753/g.148571  ORF Transcript_49753/g.148571 Transcript_49753/m.148571 type:complete len:210 (-) Transcript_49753:293-922(-)
MCSRASAGRRQPASSEPVPARPSVARQPPPQESPQLRPLGRRGAPRTAFQYGGRRPRGAKALEAIPRQREVPLRWAPTAAEGGHLRNRRLPPQRVPVPVPVPARAPLGPRGRGAAPAELPEALEAPPQGAATPLGREAQPEVPVAPPLGGAPPLGAAALPRAAAHRATTAATVAIPRRSPARTKVASRTPRPTRAIRTRTSRSPRGSRR